MKNIDAIFIEAGHGKKTLFGFDQGATAKLGEKIYTERELAKDLAQRVIEKLAPKTKCPILGVSMDTDGATLEKKTAYINGTIAARGWKNCLGIALHFNSIAGSDARGFEIFYQKKNSLILPITRSISAAMEKYKVFSPRNPSIKSTEYYSEKRLYIDDWKAGSILIETCFISNPSDLKNYLIQTDRVAESIANGILTYLRS